MNIDNPTIVLITIYSNRNDQDITTFRQLQNSLPLEKSHISQALSYNEKKDFIKKPDNHIYFSTIQITQSGILQAERYVNFLSKLLHKHKYYPKPKKGKKKLLGNSASSPNFKVVLDNLASTFFSPLKSSLKNSLDDYIPASHLTETLLDDVTDTILNFFRDQFSAIYKSKN